jgi:hypothetical protein
MNIFFLGAEFSPYQKSRRNSCRAKVWRISSPRTTFVGHSTSVASWSSGRTVVPTKSSWRPTSRLSSTTKVFVSHPLIYPSVPRQLFQKVQDTEGTLPRVIFVVVLRIFSPCMLYSTPYVVQYILCTVYSHLSSFYILLIGLFYARVPASVTYNWYKS